MVGYYKTQAAAMEEPSYRTGKTTVAFDGTLLAVDRAYWSAAGATWNATSKLQELQPGAASAFPADPIESS